MNKVKEIMQNMPELYSAYQHPRGKPVEFPKNQVYAQQHFKEDVDINMMLEKAQRQGFLNIPGGLKQPIYADFTQVRDFREARQMVIDAEEAFANLPAAVRQKFQNDPQELVDFVQDEKNREEAIKMGLIEAPEAQKPLKVGEPIPEEGKGENKPDKAEKGVK